MNALDKTISTDISLGHLLDVLAVAPDAPLVFSYYGNPVRPGYHVTEVKAGQFSALDCGANPEAWAETRLSLPLASCRPQGKLRRGRCKSAP